MRSLKKNFKKSSKKSWLYSGLASLVWTVCAIGCGQNQAPPPIVAPTASTVGSSSIALSSYCSSRGGSIVLVKGIPLCQQEIYLKSGAYQFSGGYAGSLSALPQLSPANPRSTSSGLSFNFQVQAGDKVFFSGASQWGAISINSSSALGGFFNFTTVTSNCSLANADGRKMNGSLLPVNGGIQQGLVASDQTQIYFLGSNGTAVIQNPGNLSIGINMVGNNMGCGYLQINSVRVERCVDASGISRGCS